MNEFDKDIQSGQLLPPETRIPLPEMSYEQELLNTPVPFENRIEFLSDYVKTHANPVSISRLAKELQITTEQITAMAEKFGPTTFEDKQGEKLFQGGTREVFQEELEWERYVNQLDNLVTEHQIATMLNKGQPWVRSHSYGLGIYPQIEHGNGTRVNYLYPKSIIKMLRTILMHFPPANDWFSADEVEQITGKSEAWVRSRVEELKLNSQLRMSASAHSTGIHYSPETVKTLRTLAEGQKPAGEWMTASHIAHEVGMRKEWVKERIGAFVMRSEVRLTDSGDEKVHYPQSVFNELRRQAEMAKSELLPPAGDWLTVWGVSKTLGRSVDWVNSRIGQYDNEAELRLSYAGKPEKHYSRDVIDQLRILSEGYAEAGDWVTVYGMAEHLGHTVKWVMARIDAYKDLAETRRAAVNNRPRLHYPPYVEIALNELDLDKLYN